jgi:hypothetical protein
MQKLKLNNSEEIIETINNANDYETEEGFLYNLVEYNNINLIKHILIIIDQSVKLDNESEDRSDEYPEQISNIWNILMSESVRLDNYESINF